MKIYNFFTYFWYHILHQPLRLKCAFDRKVKKPKATVIFLHGIAANSSTWNVTLKNISENPHFSSVRIVALDLLGFGGSLKSDWLKYDYDEYNKALQNSIKHLRIKSPIILVGHSMGSLIATNFASSFPGTVSELILVSPPVLKPQEVASLPDKFYLKSYGSLHKVAEDPIIKTLANFAQKVSSFRAEYLKTTAFERSMKNIVLNRNNYDTLRKINIPTFIIHGRLDALVMKPNLAEAAKDNPTYIHLFQVIAQHDISPSKRDKILLILKEFLKNEII